MPFPLVSVPAEWNQITDSAGVGRTASVGGGAEGDVDGGRGDRTGKIRRRERRHVADLLQAGRALQHRRRHDHLGDVVTAGEVLRHGLEDTTGVEGDGTDAVLAELGGELAAE